MQDAYFKPDARFFKIYKDKTRDMHSLRTEDIQGAQPKKHIYEKSDKVDNYYNTLSKRPQVDPTRQSLNYWGGKGRVGPNVHAGAAGYSNLVTQSQSVKSFKTVQPEDYNLPDYYRVPGVDYSQPQYQSPQPYKMTQEEERMKLAHTMRNPMFASYDPSRYYVARANQNAPFNQHQDSLDVLKNQYQKQKTEEIQNSPQGKRFKEDWMNFYGVESGGNTNRGLAQAQSASNLIPNKATNQAKINANTAAFFGERASAQDQYEKNLGNFFGDDSKPSNPPMRHSTKANTNNIFNQGPQSITVFNPLTQQPHSRYEKGAKKFEIVKGPRTVKEDWEFKKNVTNFYDV